LREEVIDGQEGRREVGAGQIEMVAVRGMAELTVQLSILQREPF
jgi:hypothetical protein